MSAADLVEVAPPSRRGISRIRRVLGRELARLGCRLAQVQARPRVPGGWPVAPVRRYEVSGTAATFEELERITLDPEMIARVEAAPKGELRCPERPPPVLPAAVAQLGWKPRTRPARICEVVPFAFELDLLELRLAELHDVIDQFVVAEAPRGFGGVRKPLYLQRNGVRYARFQSQLTPVEIQVEGFERLYPTGRRDRSGWLGEDAFRRALWQQVRPLALAPDTVVIWADVDEMLPRWLVHLLRHYECPLPMRVLAPALRYHFGWRDPEATAGITIVDRHSLAQIDAQPERIRSLPARTFSARGAVHLTSFLDPAVLLMKCALTTDWEPAVLPYLRNEQGEIAAMIAGGNWFGRALAPYDAERDRGGLIPEAARLNRDRFASFWPETASP
jgi:hypothetical protein